MESFSFSGFPHISRDFLHVIIILILAWLLMGLSWTLIRMFRNYMNTRAGSHAYTASFCDN